MQVESRSVTTNQLGPHDGLSRRVSRALATPWRKPVAEHTRRAFEAAHAWLTAQDAPLVLDAGCGVGLSTRALARLHENHAVIGIDRSADRLSRNHGALPDNALLVRADLVDFWRLALEAGWRPRHHYLLYPNPYPKSTHLKMRWHGHPVFPHLLGLGGRLELRSNWRIYVEEFAQALQQATGTVAMVEPWVLAGHFLTPFERKYHASGQSLWRLQADLPHAPELIPDTLMEEP
ncbi:SAM-dependent methyltransferase [Halomonas sp. MCCC 1A11036]|uniref:tRNA (guanine(46)-N(7))-methyltransferase n=1 Tax=Billgrantia zhangzhouensis TaxID=2733481 RepID=A0ABS9ALB5_9GAMM|nr:class I SAM-dependent methyltransferase [Halomonas zhangzhouensis]MCE8022514.1 SAM-dependent methyltransferase [Halomonas zhangzhouensis]